MEISPRSGGRRPWTCFNGATAFRRWRSVRFHRAAVVDRQLQWGHRLSAMEIQRVGIARHVVGLASMGPPPFGDGDIEWNWRNWFRHQELQWGHRLSAMEMFRDCTWSSGVYSLQWGHRLSAMEIQLV